VANGLHKEYLQQSEIMSNPRGRIELSGTIRAWSRGQFHLVQARRFDQSSDVAVDRLIKSALESFLQRIRPYSPESRDLVRRANVAWNEMPGVIGRATALDNEACKAILRASSLPAARHYYYRRLEIALLIMSNQGIELQKQGTDALLESFIINFEDLFEEYLRNVLQNQAIGGLTVKDGNREGKKPLFDDRDLPPAQPDILVTYQPTGRAIVAEVKYKERPSREDINQAITYALSYGCNHAILIHQWAPGVPKGLSLLGTIRGHRLDAYAFDLGAKDVEAEEKAFTDCVFGLLRPTRDAHAAA
jgi:5-methylcytosine-specific restriction enzyme subunit McrC